MKRNTAFSIFAKLALFVSLALILCLAFAASAESSGICGNNLTYTLNDEGVLTISGTGGMYNYSYTSSGGTYVTTAPWGSGVSSVSIQQGVTRIGSYAFYECSNLTSITIPDSVQSIGNYAFHNCTSLTSISIPNGVTSIPYGTFSNCNSLTSISIPYSVTSIGDFAFSGCSSLSEIVIPDTVTKIGTDAFSGCSSLNCVSISGNVLTISSGAFSSCNNLTAINVAEDNPNYSSYDGVLYNKTMTELIRCPGGKDTISLPECVETINNGAFSGCSRLTSISIPSNVTSIGFSAFSDCSSLIDIILPNSVSSIGDYAFEDCISLSQIEIPSCVTAINEFTFDHCVSLSSVIIPDSVADIGYGAFWGCHSISNITIPNSVTSIGKCAFADCRSLQSIIIPEDVEKIDNSTFQDCKSLVSVFIPDSVRYIGTSAFIECTALESIDLPESLLYIGSTAFCSCDSLISIHIPKNVSTIEEGAFVGCRSLSEITVSAENEYFTSSDGVLYNKTLTQLICYPGAKADSVFTLPVTVSKIDDSAFSVTSMNLTAFDGGSSSYSVDDGILYSWDFSYLVRCPQGKSGNVSILGNVTQMNKYAFTGCSRLQGIDFPSNNIRIGEDGTYTDTCFYGCSAVYYTSSETTLAKELSRHGWSFRPFRESPLSLRFYYDESGNEGDLRIVSVDQNASFVWIPEEITTIHEGEFSGLNSLVSILMSGSKIIEPYAFVNCLNLEYVHMDLNAGYNVEEISISENSFVNCHPKFYVDSDENYLAKVLSIAGYSFRTPGKNYSMRYMINQNSGIVYGSILCDVDKDAVSVTIPSSITNIADGAFENVVNLRSITIPANVSIIGDRAFDGCDNLEKICFLGNDTQIGSRVCSVSPLIYCYEYSEPDFWAAENEYECIYLDDIDFNSIRTITLPERIRVAQGESTVLTASLFPDTGETVIWSSSDPDIAIVDNGTINGLGLGYAVISASLGDASASAEVRVYTKAESFELTKYEVWVIAKDTVQLEITNIVPEGSECDLLWYVDNTTLATVDENGLVTTKKPGDTVVGVGINGGSVQFCTLHICFPVTAIEFAEPDIIMSVGETVALTANVTMRTQSCVNKLVTFTSSDESVATVDQNGVVTGISHGTVTIYATAANGVSAECSVTSQPAIIAEGTSGNIEWVLYNDGSLILSGSGAMSSYGLSGAPWCAYQDSITPAEIIEGVTKIDRYSFIGCANLTDITIPDSVTEIGSYAFQGCSSLNGVNLPDSITIIDSYAFYNCTSLSSITIPGSVQTIYDYAFSNCSSLVSVVIENGVRNIEQYAFIRCEQLTSVTLPNNITKIDKGIFASCGSLSALTIPDSVTSINSDAFRGCVSLANINAGSGNPSYSSVGGILYSKDAATLILCPEGVQGSIVVPEGVTSIGSKAFADCKKITDVVIPEGVTSIGSVAFYSCGELTSISIPRSVTEIGGSTFYNCSKLTIYSYPGTAAETYAQSNSIPFVDLREKLAEGSCGANVTYVLYEDGELVISGTGETDYYEYYAESYAPWYEYRESITSVTVKPGVTGLESGLFYGCTQINHVSLADSITWIGWAAFDSCDSLTEITIPLGITDIGNMNFSGMDNLLNIYVPQGHQSFVSSDGILFDITGTKMLKFPMGRTGAYTVPDDVTSIDWAFEDSKLDELTISNTVELSMWGWNSFINLRNIYVYDDNPNFSSVDGILFDKQHTTIIGFPSGRTGSYTVPDNVTVIGQHAFSYTSLNNIVLTDNITEIRDGAFGYARYLEEIEIPGSVKTIHSWVFGGSEELKVIRFCEGVEHIEDDVFTNLHHVEEIYIPDSLTGIGGTNYYDFSDGYRVYANPGSAAASLLRWFYAPGGNCKLRQDDPFGNGELMPVYLEEVDVSGMTTFTLPDYVTAIEGGYNGDERASAFQNAEQLQEVILPNGLKMIGVAAFKDCTSLNRITIPDSVVTIHEGAFENCSSLTSLVIPDSVTTILDGAFKGCTALEEITLPEELTFYDTYYRMGWWTPYDWYFVFADCSSLTSIRVPKGVNLNDSAFRNCTSLTEIVLPEGLEHISSDAFTGCDSLEDIYIYATETEFYDTAFPSEPTVHCYLHSTAFDWAREQGYQVELLGMDELRVLTLPASTTVISGRAFAGLVSADAVRIGASVNQIADDAFDGSDVVIIAPEGSYAYSWAVQNGFYVITEDSEG